jgi:hypothetical protein
MKHISRFKVFILIALTCVFTAVQGNVVVTSSSDQQGPQHDGSSATYSVSVSAGHSQASEASANLTMAGMNSQVSVEKEGSVTLVAGESIVLRPGTKVSGGGFLYASIRPASHTGKPHKKGVKVVTVEEKKKIEEQESLETACEMFKPFPSKSRGFLHAGDADNGSYFASCHELFGVSPEQQRKVAGDSHFTVLVASRTNQTIVNTAPVPHGYRPETIRVLRL